MLTFINFLFGSDDAECQTPSSCHVSSIYSTFSITLDPVKRGADGMTRLGYNLYFQTVAGTFWFLPKLK